MKSTRQAFGEKLVQMAAEDPRIVALDADLSKSTKTDLFAKKYPSRFFEMGIAEANMIGTAAGLSFTGLRPFACSFGCFLTGRYDQIRLSIAYSKAPVVLVGTHAGIGIGEDGVSQMGTEDCALMRALPGMKVLQPMDALETERILSRLDWVGPSYLRLTRQALMDFKDAPFSFQKLTFLVNKGSRIAVLATGALVGEAFQAIQGLSFNVDLWSVHCLKPLDVRGVLEVSRRYDLVLTAEDHSVIGGLGSAVAEVFACRSIPGARLSILGVQDMFAESAPIESLYERYGLSAEAIAKELGRLYDTLLPR
jgi:transketolase